MTDGISRGFGKDDRWRPDHGAAIDVRVTLLEEELHGLRKQCRARRLALARTAGGADG